MVILKSPDLLIINIQAQVITLLNQDHILENERVLLRPLQIEDFYHLKKFSINESDIWTYSLQRTDGLENLEKYMQTAINGRI